MLQVRALLIVYQHNLLNTSKMLKTVDLPFLSELGVFAVGVTEEEARKEPV